MVIHISSIILLCDQELRLFSLGTTDDSMLPAWDATLQIVRDCVYIIVPPIDKDPDLVVCREVTSARGSLVATPLGSRITDSSPYSNHKGYYHILPSSLPSRMSAAISNHVKKGNQSPDSSSLRVRTNLSPKLQQQRRYGVRQVLSNLAWWSQLEPSKQ